jgi:hypothetical protein
VSGSCICNLPLQLDGVGAMRGHLVSTAGHLDRLWHAVSTDGGCRSWHVGSARVQLLEQC